jgi:hypothetical protein
MCCNRRESVRLAGSRTRVRHVLQEVVDALELVEVHRVVLGELELLEVHVLLGHIARHVERAEQPAAARAVLMGGLAVVERRGETTLQQAGTVVVARHLVIPAAVTAFMAITLDLLPSNSLVRSSRSWLLSGLILSLICSSVPLVCFVCL